MNQATTITKSEFDNLVAKVSRLERLVTKAITKPAKKAEPKPLKLTPYAERIIRQARKERKEGWVSPTFDNVNDAIAWLNDPDAKYVNQL